MSTEHPLSARAFLETQPGYVGTALHQTVSPESDFPFVNVARWQTAEDSRRLGRFSSHPGLYRVVGT